MTLIQGLCGIFAVIESNNPLTVRYYVTDNFGCLINIPPESVLEFVKSAEEVDFYYEART